MQFLDASYKRIANLFLAICFICTFVIIGVEQNVEASETFATFEKIGKEDWVVVDPDAIHVVQAKRFKLKTVPQSGGAVMFSLYSNNLPVKLEMDISPALVKKHHKIGVQELKASCYKYPCYILYIIGKDNKMKASSVIGSSPDGRQWKEIASAAEVKCNATGERTMEVLDKQLYCKIINSETDDIVRYKVFCGLYNAGSTYWKYSPKINNMEQFYFWGKPAVQLSDIEFKCYGETRKMALYHLRQFSSAYDFSFFVPYQDCIKDVDFVIHNTTGVREVQLDIKPEKYKEVLDYLTNTYGSGEYKSGNAHVSYYWVGKKIFASLSKFDSGNVDLNISIEH